MTFPKPIEALRADMRATLKLITEYLTAGGLFNPELMEHDKVRDLLIDCRDALERCRAETLEEAARVAETEPEFEGAPEPHILAIMDAMGPIKNARASCRATKRGIAHRIRALDTAGSLAKPIEGGQGG